MPYDIVDAFTDIQETKAGINQIVDSLTKIPQIKEQLKRDGLLPEEKPKTARG